MSDVKVLPQKLVPFFVGANELHQERTRHTLQERAPALAPTALLCFAVAQEEYALPLLMVQEVCVMRAITPVPQTRAEVLGITSLRGEVIPVVDLATALGVGDASQEVQSGRGVLLADARGPVALHVHAVRGVVRLSQKDLSPRPYGLQAVHPKLVAGLGRTSHGLLTVLDGQALLQHLEQLT